MFTHGKVVLRGTVPRLLEPALARLQPGESPEGVERRTFSQPHLGTISRDERRRPPWLPHYSAATLTEFKRLNTCMVSNAIPRFPPMLGYGAMGRIHSNSPPALSDSFEIREIYPIENARLGWASKGQKRYRLALISSPVVATRRE
jgi:hypothetical protein